MYYLLASLCVVVKAERTDPPRRKSKMEREWQERKLDLQAPLLSTRRPGRIIVPREKLDLDSSSSFNDRVPFSWEQSPGKPKEILIRSRRKQENTNTNNMAFILPLKPPPIRLHPHPKHSSSKQDDDDDDDDDDDGCDGDVDDNDEDGEFFSEGLDLFSLAESSQNGKALGTKESRKRTGGRRRRRTRAPTMPSYIMERFLPAAVALAAASSSYFDTEARRTPTNVYQSHVRTPRNRNLLLPSISVSSPLLAFKTCGLYNLLPWRVKPNKTDVRTPFRFHCSDWRPQLSSTPK